MKKLILVDGHLVPHIHGGADSSNAQIGSQVALSYWNAAASPPAYQTIGKVRTLDGIGVAKPEVDSTTLDSTGVERIGGLPDGEQVTIVFTTTQATMEKLEQFLASTSSIDLKVVWPSPTNVTRYFALLPLKYNHNSMAASNLLEMTLQGRMTGAAPSSTNPHP